MKFTGKPLQIYEDITDHLEALDEDKEVVILISSKETKEMRTIQQNKTFYKLFTDIGNHLWESKEDVHDMMLWGIFWTRSVTIWRITKEINVEKHTSKLTKDQGIHFIDTMLAFVKKYDMPITVTSREIDSLYESYNVEKKVESPMVEMDQNWD